MSHADRISQFLRVPRDQAEATLGRMVARLGAERIDDLDPASFASEARRSAAERPRTIPTPRAETPLYQLLDRYAETGDRSMARELIRRAGPGTVLMRGDEAFVPSLSGGAHYQRWPAWDPGQEDAERFDRELCARTARAIRGEPLGPLDRAFIAGAICAATSEPDDDLVLRAVGLLPGLDVEPPADALDFTRLAADLVARARSEGPR